MKLSFVCMSDQVSGTDWHIHMGSFYFSYDICQIFILAYMRMNVFKLIIFHYFLVYTCTNITRYVIDRGIFACGETQQKSRQTRGSELLVGKLKLDDLCLPASYPTG